VALDGTGRTQDSVAQFQRAGLDPNNAPAVQNLGIAALRLGDAHRHGNT
jgi:hypothetical protein